MIMLFFVFSLSRLKFWRLILILCVLYALDTSSMLQQLWNVFTRVRLISLFEVIFSHNQAPGNKNVKDNGLATCYSISGKCTMHYVFVSVCKTCIVKYLQSSKNCPQCTLKIHETQPLMNLKPDRVMQDIVYKLVPNLFESKSVIDFTFFCNVY